MYKREETLFIKITLRELRSNIFEVSNTGDGCILTQCSNLVVLFKISVKSLLIPRRDVSKWLQQQFQLGFFC